MNGDKIMGTDFRVVYSVPALPTDGVYCERCNEVLQQDIQKKRGIALRGLYSTRMTRSLQKARDRQLMLLAFGPHKCRYYEVEMDDADPCDH